MAILCLNEMEKYEILVLDTNKFINAKSVGKYKNFMDIPSEFEPIRFEYGQKYIVFQQRY